MLPDDVLLDIFNSYLCGCRFDEWERGWQSLVRVCNRWRSIVFGSPRRLDLQLVCTSRTPTRDRLDIWPALPLIILVDGDEPVRSVDNIIAGLERSDRVCQIDITNVPSSNLLAEMQQPFPELIYLRLWPVGEVPVLSDSFLGGSAPSLRYLTWDSIPFPGLPKLLLSATHLRSLHLFSIPHSGYFSPDAMVTVLSTLTRLSYLWLAFESPRSCPEPATRRSPPKTRSVLPGFTHFRFKGVAEYLEDVVACIDAPQLHVLDIIFFNDIEFDTPQLMQYISRTPELRTPKEAHITLRDDGARVSFLSQTSLYPGREFKMEILCKGLDWQLLSLEQVCTSCLPPFSTLEGLYIYGDSLSQPDRKDDIENGLWLDLLQPFTAVKYLYLSEEFAPHIVHALQKLVEGRTTEVLPALQNIFLRGFESSEPVQEDIGQLVAARQVADHPIAVSRWTS